MGQIVRERMNKYLTECSIIQVNLNRYLVLNISGLRGAISLLLFYRLCVAPLASALAALKVAATFAIAHNNQNAQRNVGQLQTSRLFSAVSFRV